MSVADRVAAIDEFVRGCKSDGIWDSIKACCVMCGWDTLGSALIPLKGAAPTLYNFVSGDYSRTSGLVGNGSTKYLDTNRSVTADPQDNCHIAGYATAITSGSAVILASQSNTTTGASVLSASNPISGRLRNTSFITGTVDASPPSFAGFSRSGSSGLTARGKSASEFLSATSAAFAGAGNYDAYRFLSSVYYSTRLAFYSIGESLDLALLDARVSSLYTALRTSVAPQVSNAEAQDWVYRVYDNGGAVSQSTANAVSAFCDAIEGAGIRSKLVRVNLMCGSNINSVLVPVYRATSSSGTQLGSATDTNNNFTNDHYDESSGLVGNGTDRRLFTGLARSSISGEASLHAGMFVHTLETNTYRSYLRCDANNTAFNVTALASRSTGNLVQWADNSASALGITPDTPHAAGDFLVGCVSGEGAGLLRLYINGSSVATGTGRDTSSNTSRFSVFAAFRDDTSVWSGHSNARLGGYTLGLNLDDFESTAYATIWDTFLKALGRR
jgi:hypothetical protein